MGWTGAPAFKPEPPPLHLAYVDIRSPLPEPGGRRAPRGGLPRARRTGRGVSPVPGDGGAAARSERAEWPGGRAGALRRRGAGAFWRRADRRAALGRPVRAGLRATHRRGRADPRQDLRDQRGALQSARYAGVQSPPESCRAGQLRGAPRRPARPRRGAARRDPRRHCPAGIGSDRAARPEPAGRHRPGGALARPNSRRTVSSRTAGDDPPSVRASGRGLSGAGRAGALARAAYFVNGALDPEADLVGEAVLRQLVQAVPAGRLAFGVGDGGDAGRIPRPGEVDQGDVLVARRDVSELDARRPDELTRTLDRETGLADELDRDAGLLDDLAHRRLVRELVRLDVAARRQPPLQLAVPEQQHPLVLD